MRILCLWPGVTGLFRHGQWSFLIIALTFAFCLDSLLIAGYFWKEYITGAQRYFAPAIVFVIWIALGVFENYFEKRIELTKNSDGKRNFYSEAIVQYLRGNWFETECFLNEVLKRNPRDADALLMLATMYRHTSRIDESRQVLAKLQKLDDAAKWFSEIENELKALVEAAQEPPDIIETEIHHAAESQIPAMS